MDALPGVKGNQTKPERVRSNQMNCEAREKTAIIMTKASSELLSSSSKRLKSKPKTKVTLQRRQFYIGYLTKFSLYMLAYGFVIARTCAYFEYEDIEHEIAHEVNEQPHFPFTVFTEYTTLMNYTKSSPYSSFGMGPVYNVAHFIFDNFLSNYSALPPGYIDVKDKNILVLGSKVTENDWRDLLAHYWVALLFVFFLLILVIVMPFIAVCYCCFCCCRRYKQGGCPPCDGKAEARKRFSCGLLLLLLIIGILFGVIIVLVTNILLDAGLKETGDTMRRSSEDTCTYLKDVSKQIHHLFVNNYEELDTHINALLADAPSHIFVDLMQTSRSFVWEEVERIFSNVRNVRQELVKIVRLRNEMQFFTSQLRDGLRGVKRDVHYACFVLCGSEECLSFLERSEIEFIDSSRCLHLDRFRRPTPYIPIFDQALQTDASHVPKDAIKRLEEIVDIIAGDIDSMKLKLIPAFRPEADKIRNMIDALVYDIHLTTLRSINNFEDQLEKVGANRTNLNIVFCVVLLVIPLLLVIALICGCCGRPRHGYRDGYCSKGTGASCLLLAMLLIFAVFSLVVLVGVFYFVLGLITYQGACAPLRDQEDNPLFRRLDAAIDLNSLVSTKKEVEGQTPIRISNVLKACRANQTIFQFLKENNIYDINKMIRAKVLQTAQGDLVAPIFSGDLSIMIPFLNNLTNEVVLYLSKQSISKFNGIRFNNFMCKKLTVVELPTLANQLMELRSNLLTESGIYELARSTLNNAAYNLQGLHDEFVVKLHSLESRMLESSNMVDGIMMYRGAPSVYQTGHKLAQYLYNASIFLNYSGTNFINGLLQNLTGSIEEQVQAYVLRVINESTYNVANCAPLAHIYDRGVDWICHRLVDPINGLWVGVLLCLLLFLPVLFVSHRLICLYNQIDPYSTPTVEGSGGCPICTGAVSAVPEHTFYTTVPLPSDHYYYQRGFGGAEVNTDVGVTIDEEQQQPQIIVEEVTELPGSNKRKQD